MLRKILLISLAAVVMLGTAACVNTDDLSSDEGISGWNETSGSVGGEGDKGSNASGADTVSSATQNASSSGADTISSATQNASSSGADTVSSATGTGSAGGTSGTDGTPDDESGDEEDDDSPGSTYSLVGSEDLYISEGTGFQYAAAQNHFEALKNEILGEYHCTVLEFGAGDGSAEFHFVGPSYPNEAGSTAVSTRNARYTWSLPGKLTAGATVELRATGVEEFLTTDGGTETGHWWDSGSMSVLIFSGNEKTTEIDYVGNGTGIRCTGGTTNNILPGLGDADDFSSGSYSFSVPADEDVRTVAVCVLYEPGLSGYTVVRTYIFQR